MIDRPTDRPWDRRPPTGEHPPTRPPRTPREVDPAAGEHWWSSPAARSAVREIFGELLDERDDAEGSRVNLRVNERYRKTQRPKNIAIGGLAGLVLTLAGWAVAEVRSYGDEREEAARTAIAAEAKAVAAADEAMRVRTELDDARARVDALEPKVDEVLLMLEQLLAREAARSAPLAVPKKPRPR